VVAVERRRRRAQLTKQLAALAARKTSLHVSLRAPGTEGEW
jgi:hypothetical protein